MAHKRALGRKYHSEESALRLLLRFCAEHGVHRLGSSRRRCWTSSWPPGRARGRASFNHLLGVVRCLLDWAVAQQLLEVSPLRARRRRVTAHRSRSSSTRPRRGGCSTRPARSLTTPRAAARAATYRTIFALCYGLGLRAGEACGLRVGDVDSTVVCSSSVAASSARAGWCRTARGSPR